MDHTKSVARGETRAPLGHLLSGRARRRRSRTRLRLAFDAHADETAKEFSPAELTLTKGIAPRARRSSANCPCSNLFMVFGEPHVKIGRTDGKYVPQDGRRTIMGSRALDNKHTCEAMYGTAMR